MSIIFSDHSKQQLKIRNISSRLVLKTVENPQEVLESFRGRKLRRAKFGDKLLEVVTTTEGSVITIITAYYLEV